MTGLEPDDAQLGKRTEALFRDFENETDALLEPLAPQQIRRLGERRRTRRRATIGAGALALTTVAAGSVMGLGGLGGSNEIDTASRPSSSQTPPAQNPSAENSLATAPLPSANSSASATSSPSSVSSPTGSQVPTASPGAVTAAGWADVPGTSLVYRNRPGDLPVVAEVADDSSPQQALSICEQDRTSLGQSKDLENDKISAIAKELGVTPAQVIIRWHLQLGNVVIPKSVTPERIASNFDVFGFELTGEQMEQIATLDEGNRLGGNPETADF